MKSNLKQRVNDEKLKQFKVNIHDDKFRYNMTFDKIKALSNTYKKALKNEILSKDKELKHYLMTILKKNKEAQQDAMDGQWGIEDDIADFKAIERDFQDAMEKKELETFTEGQRLRHWHNARF